MRTETDRDKAVKSIEKHTQDLQNFVVQYKDLDLYHMTFALGALAEFLAVAMTLEGQDGRKFIDIAINENRKSYDQKRSIN